MKFLLAAAFVGHQVQGNADFTIHGRNHACRKIDGQRVVQRGARFTERLVPLVTRSGQTLNSASYLVGSQRQRCSHWLETMRLDCLYEIAKGSLRPS